MDKKIKYALIAIASLIVALLLFFGIKSLAKKQKAKKLNETINNNVVNAPNGNSIDLGGKASEIYDALHGSWFSEDEQKAIDAIKGVPNSYIPQLSNIYFTLYGKNLKADLINYLSDSQWKQISFKFI